MSKTTTWTTPGFDDAETPVAIELQQVDALVFRDSTVPVWQVAPGQGDYHAGPFIRRIDLPADLAEAFFDRWQFGANQPFVDAAYPRDFANFMASQS
ncbi:MAG: hypothetical protein K2P67_04770 [Gallionellaceae bacterium]|nr:hypothetical protein [Gallionellaceae bacterium]